MVAALIIAGSALLGLMIGLAFRIRAIALLAPFLALFAAVVLHAHRYGFVDGVMVVVGCLMASQAAYIAGAFLLSRTDMRKSMHENFGRDPGGDGEQDIRRENEGDECSPSGPLPPKT
ncbi:hypothetical protein ACSVBT_09565 [Afipia sp. TerB]